MLTETQRARIRKLDGVGARAYLKRLKVCTACRRKTLRRDARNAAAASDIIGVGEKSSTGHHGTKVAGPRYRSGAERLSTLLLLGRGNRRLVAKKLASCYILGVEISIKIPEELAAQARARGLKLEVYVQEILARQAKTGERTSRPRSPEEIRAWLDSLAQFSEKIPPLPETISREWIYQDHN